MKAVGAGFCFDKKEGDLEELSDIIGSGEELSREGG